MSDDYLDYAHLVSTYGEATAARLARLSGLTGLDGRPCVERDRLDDLLGLLAIEDEEGTA